MEKAMHKSTGLHLSWSYTIIIVKLFNQTVKNNSCTQYKNLFFVDFYEYKAYKRGVFARLQFKKGGICYIRYYFSPWALPKPTRGFAPGPHRLLKKAGENFILGWALPNPPGALPLDPFLSFYIVKEGFYIDILGVYIFSPSI